MNRITLQHLSNQLLRNPPEICVFTEPVTDRNILMSWTSAKRTSGHWITRESTETHLFVFDSYGLARDQLWHNDFIHDEDKIFVRNTISLQRLGTKYCGFYCLAYFKLREEGKNFLQAVNELTTEVSSQRNNLPIVSKILNLPINTIDEYVS